jgi:hypothetical protein
MLRFSLRDSTGTARPLRKLLVCGGRGTLHAAAEAPVVELGRAARGRRLVHVDVAVMQHRVA